MPSKALDPSSSAAAFYGWNLREARTAARLTQQQLGRAIHVTHSRIAQIELAAALPTLDNSRDFDRVFGRNKFFEELWKMVRRERFPDKYRRYMELEAQATNICEFAAHAVPGLLQTHDYAHAMLHVGLPVPESEREDKHAARMDRKSLLTGPQRPGLWAVLDEAVISRPVGGRAVMRNQLRALLEAARDPRNTLQVLPFERGEHGCMGGSMIVLENPNGTRIAYTEDAFSGRLFEDREEAEPYIVTYDQLRASALPPDESLAMISRVMEEKYRDPHIPTQSERRRLAQKQLQQQRRGSMRRGRSGVPRLGPRP
ncbi:Scr1 family TA system antitoxin-like transcriptional regulator [Streptomyces sp. NPDC092296]|uniref:helix-turn-helix domain-containing protein n=1 Tax=Streptomyces sp. NPDC092296 TaxID=3366012 RepID=UPI00381D2F49